MENVKIKENGELAISPSGTSSEKDFDFLLGNHTVHHKKLKERLAGSTEWIESDGTHKMESLLGGIGNLEQMDMGGIDGLPVKGVAFRIFNPSTRLWSIYWADNRYATVDVPMVGSFDKQIGYFYAKDYFKGKPILVKFKWDASNSDQPVWSQAFSEDKGQSWEWNWFMYFSRV